MRVCAHREVFSVQFPEASSWQLPLSGRETARKKLRSAQDYEWRLDLRELDIN